MTEQDTEIQANLERARESIEAAKMLAANSYYDFVASRAYYAVFYAAAALLIHDGLSFKKHTTAIAMIHKEFIKTGKLDMQHGRNLNWLFELRGIGDYGVTTHVSSADAKNAIQVAEDFISAVISFLNL